MHKLNTSMYISHFSQCMKMHKNENFLAELYKHYCIENILKF